MPLVIANYDPDWPSHAAREAAEVSGVEGVRQVEHVGSTAIPGLAARPTIDLLVGADDPAAVSAEALGALGYREAATPPRTGGPARAFWKGTRTFHTYELEVVRRGGAGWTRRLALRDRLRADADLAARYVHRKRELARDHAGDPAAYAEAKAALVDTLL